MGLSHPGTVDVLPAAHQLVQVARRELLGVFLQHLQVLHALLQQHLAGGEVRAPAAGILIHQLLDAVLVLLRQDVVRVDFRSGGEVLELLEPVKRGQDLGLEGLDNRRVHVRQVGVLVNQVLAGGLAGDAAFRVRTGGELVAGRAGGVTGGEQAIDRGQVGVAPEVFRRRYVVRTADPGAGGPGVRTDEVRLSGGDFGLFLLGVDVAGRPQEGLGDGHVEEVFPSFVMEVLHLLLEGLLVTLVLGGEALDGVGRLHVDRALAGRDVDHTKVVTQVGRDRLDLAVLAPLFEFGGVGHHIVFAEGVGRDGLEEQEPRADRAVSVLEADRNEPDFLAGHLGAGLDGEVGAGAGGERRVPGPAETLTGGPRTEHAHAAAHRAQDGLRAEHVELLLADTEADRTGDPVVFHNRFHDEHALVDVILAEGVLGGFRHDDLVGLTVDHNLPAAAPLIRTDPEGVVFAFRPDRQTPLLEQVHGGVDVPGDVVNEVVAGDTHQVIPHVLHVVHHGVLIVAQADIQVDGREALSNGTAPVHGGFVNQGHFQPVLFRPVRRFHRRTAGRHAATDDQEISGDFYSFKIRHSM